MPCDYWICSYKFLMHRNKITTLNWAELFVIIGGALGLYQSYDPTTTKGFTDAMDNKYGKNANEAESMDSNKTKKKEKKDV